MLAPGLTEANPAHAQILYTRLSFSPSLPVKKNDFFRKKNMVAILEDKLGLFSYNYDCNHNEAK